MPGFRGGVPLLLGGVLILGGVELLWIFAHGYHSVCMCCEGDIEFRPIVFAYNSLKKET